jgi:uncharacterized protein (TIGR00252 family)
VSTTDTGRQAEEAAAQYLLRLGYEILQQNWRTRWCEIDIIARKKDWVYFVEVKFRRNNNWGGGLEYITSKKLQQMEFAAQMWVNAHHWPGQYTVSAVEVSGDQFAVSAWLEDVSK